MRLWRKKTSLCVFRCFLNNKQKHGCIPDIEAVVGIRGVFSPFEQRPLKLQGYLSDRNGRKLNQHLQQVRPDTVLGRLVVDVTWGSQNRGVWVWVWVMGVWTHNCLTAGPQKPDLPAMTHWVCWPFLYWWRWACGRRDAGTRAPTPGAAQGRTGRGGCCTSACGFRLCAARNRPRSARRGEADVACPLQEEQTFNKKTHTHLRWLTQFNVLKAKTAFTYSFFTLCRLFTKITETTGAYCYCSYSPSLDFQRISRFSECVMPKVFFCVRS